MFTAAPFTRDKKGQQAECQYLLNGNHGVAPRGTYSGNGVTSSHRTEHKPQPSDARWKEPDTKGHTLYDSTYMKYPEQRNPETERAEWMPAAGKTNAQWTEASFWGDENVLELDGWRLCNIANVQNATELVHFSNLFSVSQFLPQYKKNYVTKEFWNVKWDDMNHFSMTHTLWALQFPHV